MADIINLAEFQFDTDRLEASLKRSQDRFLDLKQEQEKYNQLANASKKIIQELTAANLKLAASEEENTDAIEENNKLIAEANEAYRQNVINSKNVQNNLRSVSTEISRTEQQLRSYMNGMGEFESLQSQANALIQQEVRNKNEARAANLELQKISNQLNPSIAEEAALLTQVNAQIDKNTAFIKENSSATAQQAMNVGRYKESILEAYEEIEKQKKALEELNKELIIQQKETEEGSEAWKIFNQQINNNNTQINILVTDMAKARGEVSDFNEVLEIGTGGIGGFIEASNRAGGAGKLIEGSFKAAGAGISTATKSALAFIATPLGATIALLAAAVGLVVGAFKFVTASLNSTEEGSAKLAKVTATVTGIFNGLFKVLKPIGEFVGGVLIDAFNDAADVIDTTVTLIAKGLDAIGLDTASKAVSEFGNAAREGAKDAADLADAELELEKANRQARITQLEYQKDAEKLRQTRDDEAKTIPQRIAANEELGRVLQKQLEAELAIANQALKVADLRIKAEGQTTEALNARAEALTNIADIQERITGQESEQLANLNSLRRDAEAEAKERRQKAIDDYKKQSEEMVKSMKLELDMYIASQGTRKKSLDEQLKFEQDFMNKSIAIAKTELDRKLISRKEYDLKVLQAQNEFGARQVELVIENADAELQAFISANERKIVEGQFFNDELYQQEIDRINRITEEQQALETLRYQQGEINLMEYQRRIAALDQADYDQREAVRVEREEAVKAQEAANLALEVEAAGAAFDVDLALQMKQYQAQYEAEKAAAIANGADMIAFEKAQAEKKKQIEQTVQQNKLQLASNAFGQLAAIAGEESAAGKAFAVAQATIDTYASATSAFNSLSGIPIVGPVLGGIAAAAAVAAGIANVKKILAVKTPNVEAPARPSYASGVILARGAGTGTSDSIPANISNGESVITARASQMFPNTLSAINQAGGGVGLDGQLSNTILQNNLSERAESSINLEAITQAVAVGAQIGTQQGATDGMIGLADNRKIQADAKS